MRLQVFLMDKRVIQNKNSKIDFAQKYDLFLPIENIDNFKAFDQNLTKNTLLKTDVVSMEYYYINFIYVYLVLYQ